MNRGGAQRLKSRVENREKTGKPSTAQSILDSLVRRTSQSVAMRVTKRIWKAEYGGPTRSFCFDKALRNQLRQDQPRVTPVDVIADIEPDPRFYHKR